MTTGKILNYERELDIALQAAQKGREILLRHYGKILHVEMKEQAGLVSEADRNSEKAIRTHLLSNFPNHEFLGEEEAYLDPSKSRKKEGTPYWVVDPLDGTTNFIHGFPIFCVSIGLVVGHQPVVGVIDVPLLNKTYFAHKGGGAYVDSNPIQVSRTNSVANCLAATGFNSEKEIILSEQIEIFNRVVRKARGVRRPGAAAYDLCMVASGVFDFFWEQALSPWDVAGGQILVEEAGGIVTQIDGAPYDPWKASILASNTLVHDEVVKIITNTPIKR